MPSGTIIKCMKVMWEDWPKSNKKNRKWSRLIKILESSLSLPNLNLTSKNSSCLSPSYQNNKDPCSVKSSRKKLWILDKRNPCSRIIYLAEGFSRLIQFLTQNCSRKSSISTRKFHKKWTDVISRIERHFLSSGPRVIFNLKPEFE